MACYRSIGGLNINRINSTNLNDYFLGIKEISEEIERSVEGTSARNCKKKIYSLNLKKSFELFVKDKKDISEKDKYALFIKNHVAELLLQVTKYEEIFKSEELDKTNPKHIENLRKMILVFDEIREIDLVFSPTLNKSYRGTYQLKGTRKN